MKIAGIALLISGSLCVIMGTAIMTASGRPPEWANWYWQVGPIEVHANKYAVWGYTEDKSGTWSTDLIFWPPRVQRSYISHAAAEMLKDDRAWSYEPAFDPAFYAEYKKLREADESHSLTWPDYWRKP